jgi:GNAT superfamily N-acetyltransferase
MSAGRGLSLRIVERPGLCLKSEALGALLGELRQVARAVLPEGELEYGVLGGDRERLDNTVVTVIYDAKGAPVAFNALALMDATLAGRPVEVLHLGLVMVDPALRGRGLSEMLYGLTCVLVFLRRRCRPVRLSNVTQVPAVVGMVAETFDQVFPTPERTMDPSFAHRMLARQIMARHRHAFGVGPEAIFDEERSVILNSYTGGSDDLKKTFAAAPKHRKEPYNAMCQRELDYDRGDDFLQIGQINMEAAGRYLSRVARPHSGLWFAGRMVLFAFSSALLPALHWFDAREPLGRLRPRKAPAP